jgi:hypothetical protein
MDPIGSLSIKALGDRHDSSLSVSIMADGIGSAIFSPGTNAVSFSGVVR